jgi:hypothetical protein
MPLIPGPGQPVDALGDHVDGRRGRPGLLRLFPLVLLASLIGLSPLGLSPCPVAIVGVETGIIEPVCRPHPMEAPAQALENLRPSHLASKYDRASTAAGCVHDARDAQRDRATASSARYIKAISTATSPERSVKPSPAWLGRSGVVMEVSWS